MGQSQILSEAENPCNGLRKEMEMQPALPDSAQGIEEVKFLKSYFYFLFLITFWVRFSVPKKFTG